MQDLVEKYVTMRRAIKADGKLTDGMDWLFSTIINDLKETAVAIDNAIDVKNKRVADAESAAAGLEKRLYLLADSLENVAAVGLSSAERINALEEQIILLTIKTEHDRDGESIVTGSLTSIPQNLQYVDRDGNFADVRPQYDEETMRKDLMAAWVEQQGQTK